MDSQFPGAELYIVNMYPLGYPLVTAITRIPGGVLLAWGCHSYFIIM